MSSVLYRKYRSQNLAELVGQDHLVRALQSAIDNNNLGHSLLFTGTRGTGKTSTARIVAKMINQIDTDSNLEQYLDIVEIDAASNRGIEEIKDLKIKAYGLPAQLKKKVYIIDEVHMLSKDAFNALLKILEEPPSHVLFILATTEVDKIPETILSRTSRYDFKKITPDKILAHLKKIVSLEKIEAEEVALSLIAKLASGSLRDALTILETYRNDRITSELIINSLGLIGHSQYQELINFLIIKDFSAYQNKIDQYIDNGLNPIKFLLLFAEEVLASSLFINNPKQTISALAEASITIKNSPSPYIVLLNLGIMLIDEDEIGFKSKSLKQDNIPKLPSESPNPISTKKTTIIEIDPGDIVLDSTPAEEEILIMEPTTRAEVAPKQLSEFDINILTSILKKKNILLSSYVKQSYFKFNAKEIIFSHPSKLAKATITKPENQALIKIALEESGYLEYNFVWKDNHNQLQEEVGPISGSTISNNIAKLAEEIFKSPGGKYGESR